MKNLFFLTLVAALLFTACENQEQLKTEKQEIADKKGTSKPIITYHFDDVPDEVVKKAQKAYGKDLLPAVVIAFTETRGDKNIILEEGWNYSIYRTPDPDCEVESSLYDERQGYMLSTGDNGFTFIEEQELCSYGTYAVDNRQGGWFDYVCGPDGFDFEYEKDKTTFVLVRLWCE